MSTGMNKGKEMRTSRQRLSTNLNSFVRGSLLFFASVGFCADWPQYLGPNMDGIAATSSVVLARTFPAEGPPVVWHVDPVGSVGGGGVSVRDGRVYVVERVKTDSERENSMLPLINWMNYAPGQPAEEVVRCLDLRTGAEYWRTAHAYNKLMISWSPYCIPTVDETQVYVTDNTGWIYCLDKMTGKERWKWNLAEQYGVWLWSQFGYTTSPTVYKDMVVLPVLGATASAIAWDKATGAPRWIAPPIPVTVKCKSRFQGTIGTKPALAHFGGVDQFVIVACDQGIFSVDANTGKILWKEFKDRSWPNANPVIMEDTQQIYLTADFYGDAGGLACRVTATRKANGFTTTTEELDRTNSFCANLPPVRHKGYLYGIMNCENRTTGSGRCRICCVNATTGKICWQEVFPTLDGGIICSHDGLLYYVSNNGREKPFRIITPNPAHYEEIYGGNLKYGYSWLGGILVDGYLLVKTTCYDVSDPAHTTRSSVTPFSISTATAGQSAGELCNRLNAPYWKERMAVMDALAQLSGTAAVQAAPLLMQALRSGDWFKASSACTVLRRLGPTAKSIAPDLVAFAQSAMKSHDWSLAAMALDALASINTVSLQQVSPAVLELLKSPDNQMQRHALQLVSHLEAATFLTADAVIALHNGPDNVLTRSSIIVLGDMASAADKVVPVLVADLDKTDPQKPDLQFLAMAALRKMGPAAKNALPAIQAKVAKSEIQDVNKLLADTVECVAQETGVPR